MFMEKAKIITLTHCPNKKKEKWAIMEERSIIIFPSWYNIYHKYKMNAFLKLKTGKREMLSS